MQLLFLSTLWRLGTLREEGQEDVVVCVGKEFRELHGNYQQVISPIHAGD